MPKSLEPGNRLVFILAGDVDKPKATQPRIFGRTLTAGQMLRFNRSLQVLQSASGAEDQINAAIDTLEACLTGWENMIDPATRKQIPYSRESLADVLDLQEMLEIIDAVASGGRLSNDERKKSESPRSSGAAKSASRARRGARK